MKTKVKKTAQKYPLLRCPECGYEYRPESHGWAFRTDKNTKCIGLPIEGENLSIVGRTPAFNHPFQVVEE